MLQLFSVVRHVERTRRCCLAVEGIQTVFHSASLSPEATLSPVTDYFNKSVGPQFDWTHSNAVHGAATNCGFLCARTLS
jgi:hypothetical protein